MKRWILASLLLTFAVSLSRAEGGEDLAACQELVRSCQSAGYVRNGHKTGKGLIMDCMDPVIAGQTVAGVSASEAAIKDCKEKRAHHKEMKAKRNERMKARKEKMEMKEKEKKEMEASSH